MIALHIGDGLHTVEVVRRRPQLVLRVAGREYVVECLPDAGDDAWRLRIDGVPVTYRHAAEAGRAWVRLAGQTVELRPDDPFAAERASGAAADEVRAPMPGLVVELHCCAGQEVSRGDALVTVESMKLLTVLAAPRDGTVAEIARDVGAVFARDEAIVRLAPLAAEG